MIKEIFKIGLVLSFFYSCNTIKIVNCPVREKLYESVTMGIPKFKKREAFFATAERPVDYIFWYQDSAAIYISTESGGSNINYDIIRSQDSLYKKRFLSDSILLKGQDSKGRFWMDYKINGIFIGYSKVKLEDKTLFDNAIQSLQINKRKNDIK